jgi:hypothetical protein
MKLALLAIVIILLAMVFSVSANYWTSSVSTNSSSWSISRHSGNISFSLSSAVEGNTSPTELHGRVLGAYQSHYAEVRANDVWLQERTSSLEGEYKSENKINLRSSIEQEVDIQVFKPTGSDIYTFTYYEIWPVLLTASRTLKYSGKQINDLDFEGNNRDLAGSKLLYNRQLSKERRTVMWLDRMNATVLATDDAILQAEFMPTKYFGHMIRANTTGIADLSYRLSDSQYAIKRREYPALSEGEERYYGAYNLARKIETRSIFEKSDAYDADYVAYSWLPCCNDGADDEIRPYQKDIGTNIKGIFNYTCYKCITKHP